MKTYVAEIDGVAILAFRAENDEDASQRGPAEVARRAYAGDRHADGRMLWDGESEIKVRPATDEEHMRWVEVRDSSEMTAVTAGDSEPDIVMFMVPTTGLEHRAPKVMS